MKEITIMDFEKAKEQSERLKLLGINMYVEPKKNTMTRINKYRRHKIFNLGIWRVDWNQLTMK